MNKPGEFEADDVVEALKKVNETTLQMKKSLGFHVISSDHSKILEKIEQRYTFLAFSIDFFFLGDKTREEMKKLKEFLK